MRHLVDAGIGPLAIDALALSKRPGDVKLASDSSPRLAPWYSKVAMMMMPSNIVSSDV